MSALLEALRTRQPLPEPGITQALLKKHFEYLPETGQFVRLIASGTAKSGSIAGHKNGDGYVLLSINRTDRFAHRCAWLYVTGRWPDHLIDHINGVRDDNRWANLRDVPRELNAQNMRRAPSNKKSGLPLGVTVHNRKGQWMAQISIGRKNRFLGFFSTPEEAHAAYVEAKRVIHPGNTL